MPRKISMNNALEEFYDLATSNKIIEIETAGLTREELSFVTLETFLGEQVENNSTETPAQSLLIDLIDKEKMYCFYFCDIKTTIIRNRNNSHGKSYFDVYRSKKTKVDSGFASDRSTNEFFVRKESNSTAINDSVFEFEDDFGQLRNAIYDINDGRRLPEPPAIIRPELANNSSHDNTYISIDTRSHTPTLDVSVVIASMFGTQLDPAIVEEEEISIGKNSFRFRRCHKMMLGVFILIGNVSCN